MCVVQKLSFKSFFFCYESPLEPFSVPKISVLFYWYNTSKILIRNFVITIRQALTRCKELFFSRIKFLIVFLLLFRFCLRKVRHKTQLKRMIWNLIVWPVYEIVDKFFFYCYICILSDRSNIKTYKCKIIAGR